MSSTCCGAVEGHWRGISKLAGEACETCGLRISSGSGCAAGGGGKSDGSLAAVGFAVVAVWKPLGRGVISITCGRRCSGELSARLFVAGVGGSVCGNVAGDGVAAPPNSIRSGEGAFWMAGNVADVGCTGRAGAGT